MSDSSLTPASAIHDIVRIVLSTALDRPAYGLLRFMYELFFNVASADIFSNDTIMKFYGRVQLILGVFMMFQLAMIIIRGIANPDNFFSGEKGAGNLLKRVCVSLFLLVALVPINIPVPKNEYEHQLNNNGLLFGTLYSLQYRLLSNNTLGKLILGNNDESYNYTSDSPDATKNLRRSSRVFASTILKGFYKINLIPDEQDANGKDIRKHADDKTDDMITDNRICQEDIDEIIAVYKQDDVDPQDIISMVNETCAGDGWVKMPEWTGAFGTWLERRNHNNFYVFAYTGFISAIVGFIFAFILLSFSIDVAVRAIKLAVLRLIAPIPIITYMDPKGSKDGAFNSWVKTLTSTYIDLFVRLAVVYFVIFLIQDMMTNGISINSGSGIVGGTSYIIIWIGLFIFAKQAPKFFRKILGLKDDGGFKLFGGIGEAMGAAAFAGGTIGSFAAGRRASIMADETNGRNRYMPWNMAKHLVAGIAGGVGGMATGMSAWQGAKDHEGKTVMEALQKRNATAIQRGASGSTFVGRTGANLSRSLFGDGNTRFDRETRRIAQLKDIEKAGKDLFSYLEGKGKTDGATENVTTSAIDALGGATLTGTLNDFNRLKAQALADQQRGIGNGSFTFDGHTINAHDAVATKIEEELAYAAGDKWASAHSTDAGYAQKRDTYNEAVKGAAGNLADKYVPGGGTDAVGVSQLKKRFKAAGGQAIRGESDERYKKSQADYNAAKKN